LTSERDEHLDVILVGLLLPFDDVLGASEELGCGERFGRRRGVGEEEGVEIADGFRSRELPKREVPLRACRSRFLIRAQALNVGKRRLPCRPPGLTQGTDESGGERDCRNERERHGRAMAVREFGRAVGERIRARGDRLIVEVPPEIVGECGHRRVPCRRILLQGFRHDRVEIAHQHAAQAVWRRAALGGSLAQRCAVIGR
jgi:hypothetical protein